MNDDDFQHDVREESRAARDWSEAHGDSHGPSCRCPDCIADLTSPEDLR